MFDVGRLRIVVWSLVLALGLLRLASPLAGDQALFLFYALGLNKGQTLYVDLWDIKQPGIFWFYWIAGRLFGFTSVGLHIFEWIWMAAAGYMLSVAARLEFSCRWIAELVPLFTIGLYYWCASAWFMTQVEGLVALPLAGCLLTSVLAVRRPQIAGRMHLLFGFCTAIVVVLKIILVVVPVALWFVMIRYALFSQSGSKLRAMGWSFGVALCGAVLPLAGVAWHFAIYDAWEAFIATNFIWPRLALREIEGKPLSAFFYSARWWLVVSLPSLILLLCTRKDFRRRRLKLIEAQAIAWLAAGLAVILLQRLSWWGYHFLLLLWPISLIGLSAADRLLSYAADSRDDRLLRATHRNVAIAAVAMFALYPVQMVRGLSAAGEAIMAPPGSRLEAFQYAIDQGARERVQVVSKLRMPAAERGEKISTVYAFGNPNWILDFNRPQALPIHGWMWELMLERDWEALPAQLSVAKPSLLYVDDSYLSLIEQRSPATFQFIVHTYVPVLRTGAPGTWYRLSSDHTHKKK